MSSSSSSATARVIGTLVHLMAAANFGVAIYKQLNRSPVPKDIIEANPVMAYVEKFHGPWKFLTFWNLWVQLGFAVVCLVNDFIGSRRKSSNGTLVRVEDFLFASLAFPIGMFVGSAFWGLYAIDRELVYPTALDKIVPTWVNHALHTTVIPFQLFELLFVRHVYPSTARGVATSMTFNAVYISWVFVIAQVGGFWVYPVLEVLNPIQRGAFLVLCSFFGGFLFLVGRGVNALVWGKGVDNEGEKGQESRDLFHDKPKKRKAKPKKA